MSKSVVVCTWGTGRDGLPAGAEEVLTVGHKLGAALGADLTWLVVGRLPERCSETAAKYGVATIDHIDDARLACFQADPYVQALAAYSAAHSPLAFLLNQTFDARLVAPRLAARSGAGVVMNAVDIALNPKGHLAVTASAYGGDTRVVYEVTGAATAVIGVMADALLPEPAAATSSPAVRRIETDAGDVAERVRILEAAHTEGPRVEDAQIIVAGGRGLGEAANFRLIEELAAAVGGMAGASRPIVDEGWADRSSQVGLTGKITRPVLYIAAGISGASQHMVGCSAAKTLVAINRDADASIFRYATYGIVGDCLEVLPELTRAVKGS